MCVFEWVSVACGVKALSAKLDQKSAYEDK